MSEPAEQAGPAEHVSPVEEKGESPQGGGDLVEGAPEGELTSEPADPPPGRPSRSRLQRLAPLVLLAGAFVVGSLVLPKVPHERELELRLEDPATVVGVEAAWLEHDAPRGQPISGEAVQVGTWHFAAGTAPPSVIATVRLPDGTYDLEVSVDRAQQTGSTHRVVSLGDADRVTVRVR